MSVAGLLCDWSEGWVGSKAETLTRVMGLAENRSTVTRSAHSIAEGTLADPTQFADENFKLRHTGPGVLCKLLSM